MKKYVNIPLIRMSVVLAILITLSVWQIGFIISAVSSNVVLNLTIFGVFFFGVFLVYRSVLSLRNEGLALQSLQEAYSDAMIAKRGSMNDPMWKHARCNEMAIVFKKPDVLGPTFHLMSEELAKNKDISLSPSTMQTLIDAIDVRLQDRKALTQYISGILVLLGLIGTFLGLMLTLASVGEILKALDLSSGDPTAAIAVLMKKLQVPLQGMAVGFSSSLFGLVTSLVLSLMVRFSAMAFSEFVQNIEGWLSTIVEFEPGSKNAIEGVSGGQGAMIEEKRLSLIMRAARISVASNKRHNDKLDNLANSVNTLTQTTSTLTQNAQSQHHAIDELIATSRQMYEQGNLLGSAMAKTIDSVQVIATNQGLKNEVLESTNALARQLEIRDDHMANRLAELDKQLSRFEIAVAAPVEQTNIEKNEDAYDLLEEIKESLEDGDMASMHDNLKDMDNMVSEAREKLVGQQQTSVNGKKG
jgi:hypothetical protein